MFDFDPWLRPLGGENPSGESLRNDQRFHELEALMRPRVEVVRDERNNAVAQNRVPVDWGEVLRKAEELRPHGRDLRLLVIVTRALANERCFAGLGDGLTLIARTLEAHWPTLHPELRDGVPPRDAALRRINALLQLQNDQDGTLGDLRAMEFFAPRGVGPISGRDLELGTLDTRAMLSESPSGLNESERAALASAHEQRLGRVRTGCAAQADQSGPAFLGLIAEARAAAAALDALEAALNAGIGEGTGVALPDLTRFLGRVIATLDRAAAAPGKGGETSAPSASITMAPAATQTPAPAGNFPDRLATRDEVVKCLDLIIAFYDRTEPSSPIPHLARRVRRMVPMDFLELMEDLAPSGLKEFRLLAGVPDASKQSQRTKGDTA